MAEMIAGARAYIATPSVTPLGGGVLGVAHVIDTDGHELMGAQYLSDACADVEEWTEWCDMSPTATKLFDHASTLVEGDPFAVYAGVECHIQVTAEADAEARSRLTLAEGRHVDRKVIELMDASTDTVDLGGPFPIEEAIGVAEAYMATIYGGVPTLLVPRVLVPCACREGVITYGGLDGRLVTCQGSPVANVTTPIDDPFTGTSATIYVTGQITLLRSSVTAISVPQQTRLDGTFSAARALAERIYVPLFECLVAKVEASCS